MLLGGLSSIMGTNDAGARLFLSILSAYPLSYVHRKHFYNKSPTVQHWYFVLAGISIYLFNCGSDTIHCLLSTFAAYFITNYLGGTKESIIAAHTVFLGHLLWGYWMIETDDYDISWTTPYCVMCLRYIGLVMDVYDGYEQNKSKSSHHKNAIKCPPTLLETAAFGLFFTGTLAGPQFSLSRFRSFVNGEYLDEQKRVRDSGLSHCIQRVTAGFVYLFVYSIGMKWLPEQYFSSQQYYQRSFLMRWTLLALWSKFMLAKYCGAWLITEGAAILNGIAYNGKDSDGKDRWDGVRDLHIIRWETGSDFNSLVLSFNCGTNTFAKNHIFRRLRWLNNKAAAHFVTLMYLAIWHGYHLGYFLLFAFEFAIMMVQQDFYKIIERSPELTRLFQQKWMRSVSKVVGRIIVVYTLGYGFLPMGLVSWKRWIGPLTSIYFVPYILFFAILPYVFRKIQFEQNVHHHQKPNVISMNSSRRSMRTDRDISTDTTQFTQSIESIGRMRGGMVAAY